MLQPLFLINALVIIIPFPYFLIHAKSWSNHNCWSPKGGIVYMSLQAPWCKFVIVKLMKKVFNVSANFVLTLLTSNSQSPLGSAEGLKGKWDTLKLKFLSGINSNPRHINKTKSLTTRQSHLCKGSISKMGETIDSYSFS